MEGTQSELRARLTDGLCGNHTHSLTFLNQLARCKVAAITIGANTALRFASQHGTDFHVINRRFIDDFCQFLVDFLSTGNDQFTCLRMENIVQCHTAQNAVIQQRMLAGFFDFLTSRHCQTAQCATVFFSDDDIMRHVNETTGQVTGVGGLQSGIGQTLTGTVCGNEVFQHRQTFLEVRQNRVFNDFST